MSENIEQAVRSRYGSVALSDLSSNQDGVRAVAEAFGYTAEELASIPAEANMGLSCGNPTATANLREGETVVDLGSGGGLSNDPEMQRDRERLVKVCCAPQLPVNIKGAPRPISLVAAGA